MRVIEKNPRPPDFCGQPPCPHCYDIVGDDGGGCAESDALNTILLDMLGRVPTLQERENFAAEMTALHCNAPAAPVAPEDSAGTFFEVDIGMSSMAHHNGILKQLAQATPPSAPALTLDAIADRNAARQAAEEKKEQEREARARELAEIMRAAKAAQPAKPAINDAEFYAIYDRVVQLLGIQAPQFWSAQMARGLAPEDIERLARQTADARNSYVFTGLPSNFIWSTTNDQG